jgi:hemoglobin
MTNPASTQAVITEEDITRLVSEFYVRVRKDSLLGPIFSRTIENWPHHMAKLQDFWSSVMLTSGRYKGQPMLAHLRHEKDMTRDNFDRWLSLWRQTSDELLAPEAAAAFQDRARRIAESLRLGVEFHRERRSVA